MRPSELAGWFVLLGRAIVVGLVGSLALALAVLAFAPPVAAGEAGHGLRLFGAQGETLGYAPRLRTDVAIRVSGALARVRVQQRFRNPGDAWVEGIYVFPLPEDGAVDRLRMVYGERVIIGEIQERQQARASYDRARAAGQGASLVDQQRENLFTTSVANIPPGETVLVEIEYQQPVRWDAGAFSLRLPTVVGPRYIPGEPLPRMPDGAGPGWSPDTDEVPDASHITPPVAVGDGIVNPLAIDAQLDTGLRLSHLDSPTHAVRVAEQAPGRYHVALADGPVAADRDFVLEWRPVIGEQPAAALFGETWEGRHYGLLMVMPPPLAPVPVARELILVVDTSGSMHGDSIEQARAALLAALAQLRPGDRFNVIQFNNEVHALFDVARPADRAHLAQARAYVQRLRADGGTEMLPAMRRALQVTGTGGLLRQVVFLTDGAIGNEQALFETVAAGIGDSRLFTVGIGSAPNALFMTRAATFGRGTFTYIGSVHEVQAKVDRLFHQLSAPVLTDVRLDWEGEGGPAEVTAAPEVVPDLYVGEPLVVAVEADRPPRRVRISGRLGGHPWEKTVDLHGLPTEGVHALWARRRIDDWMARLATGAVTDTVRSAVLTLALEHRLVSRYTSLVAVDRTPARPADQDLVSAAVPAQLPAGWSAAAVFGRLPTTATPAPLFAWLGLGALLGALALRRRHA